MVYFICDIIYGNGNIGGWNPLWKIIGGIIVIDIVAEP
jgi:hypothetical protein